MIVLSDLKRASDVLNITAIAREAGLNPQSLLARLRRESPELTVTESGAIDVVLRRHGVIMGQPVASEEARGA